MKDIRVLLVDDETLVRKSLKVLLPWDKYAMKVVGEASNGEEAMQWLEENQADIAFVDLSMPVMDGFELCQQISRSHPQMLKIVLTCHAELHTIQRAIEGNISGYLIKTDFDMSAIEKLMARVSQTVRENESRRVYALMLVGRIDIASFQKSGMSVSKLSDDVAMLWTSLLPTSVLQQMPDGIIVKLTDEQAKKVQTNKKDLNELLERGLAYEQTTNVRVYSYIQRPKIENEKRQQLLLAVRRGEWLLSVKKKNEILAAIEEAYMPISSVIDECTALWRSMDCILRQEEMVMFKTQYAWMEVRNCMEKMYEAFDAYRKRTRLSEDTVAVMLRTIVALQEPHVLFGKTEDVAAMAGFSRSHFSRCFTQFMGMSCRHYMQTMRMRYVQEKVEKEGLCLSEIAESLGYINEEYFHRVYTNSKE